MYSRKKTEHFGWADGTERGGGETVIVVVWRRDVGIGVEIVVKMLRWVCFNGKGVIMRRER